MNQEGKSLYKRVRDFYEDFHLLLADVKTELKKETELEELADTHYVATEADKLLTEAAKDARRVLRDAQNIACFRWLQTTIPGETDVIRTDHVTSKVDIRQMAALPKKDKNPEQYAAFMRYLQVPEYLISYPHEVLRIHWPGYVEMCSEILAMGASLPDGLDPDSMYTQHELRIRHKKPILPEGE